MKYELTDDVLTVVKTDNIEENLFRIMAIKDFKLVDGTQIKKGDLGGYISSEKNLSQEGMCWVMDETRVYENAVISDNAIVRNCANVLGNAKVSDDAQISGQAVICDNAKVFEFAQIYGSATVGGGVNNTLDEPFVCGNARVYGSACVGGNALVTDSAVISDDAWILDNSQIIDEAKVYGDARILGNSIIQHSSEVFGKSEVSNQIVSDSIIGGLFTNKPYYLNVNSEQIKLLKESKIPFNCNFKTASSGIVKVDMANKNLVIDILNQSKNNNKAI